MNGHTSFVSEWAMVNLKFHFNLAKCVVSGECGWYICRAVLEAETVLGIESLLEGLEVKWFRFKDLIASGGDFPWMLVLLFVDCFVVTCVQNEEVFLAHIHR